MNRGPTTCARRRSLVRAKGGAEASIRTVHVVSDMIAETPGGKVTVPTTIRVRYPRQFRIDSAMPSGPLVQVFDSGTYWVRDARGVNELSDGAAESMRQNVVRDHISLLLALHEGRLAARRLADVPVDSRMMPALSVNLKLSGPLVLIFDPATDLIVKQRYPARGVKGRSRNAGRLPRRQGRAGRVLGHRPASWRIPITRVIRSFDYNVPLDASIFTRPS